MQRRDPIVEGVQTARRNAEELSGPKDVPVVSVCPAVPAGGCRVCLHRKAAHIRAARRMAPAFAAIAKAAAQAFRGQYLDALEKLCVDARSTQKEFLRGLHRERGVGGTLSTRGRMLATLWNARPVLDGCIGVRLAAITQVQAGDAPTLEKQLSKVLKTAENILCRVPRAGGAARAICAGGVPCGPVARTRCAIRLPAHVQTLPEAFLEEVDACYGEQLSQQLVNELRALAQGELCASRLDRLRAIAAEVLSPLLLDANTSTSVAFAGLGRYGSSRGPAARLCCANLACRKKMYIQLGRSGVGSADLDALCVQTMMLHVATASLRGFYPFDDAKAIAVAESKSTFWSSRFYDVRSSQCISAAFGLVRTQGLFVDVVEHMGAHNAKLANEMSVQAAAMAMGFWYVYFEPCFGSLDELGDDPSVFIDRVHEMWRRFEREKGSGGVDGVLLVRATACRQALRRHGDACGVVTISTRKGDLVLPTLPESIGIRNLGEVAATTKAALALVNTRGRAHSDGLRRMRIRSAESFDDAVKNVRAGRIELLAPPASTEDDGARALDTANAAIADAVAEGILHADPAVCGANDGEVGDPQAIMRELDRVDRQQHDDDDRRVATSLLPRTFDLNRGDLLLRVAAAAERIEAVLPWAWKNMWRRADLKAVRHHACRHAAVCLFAPLPGDPSNVSGHYPEVGQVALDRAVQLDSFALTDPRRFVGGSSVVPIAIPRRNPHDPVALARAAFERLLRGHCLDGPMRNHVHQVNDQSIAINAIAASVPGADSLMVASAVGLLAFFLRLPHVAIELLITVFEHHNINTAEAHGFFYELMTEMLRLHRKEVEFADVLAYVATRPVIEFVCQAVWYVVDSKGEGGVAPCGLDVIDVARLKVGVDLRAGVMIPEWAVERVAFVPASVADDLDRQAAYELMKDWGEEDEDPEMDFAAFHVAASSSRPLRDAAQSPSKRRCQTPS